MLIDRGVYQLYLTDKKTRPIKTRHQIKYDVIRENTIKHLIQKTGYGGCVNASKMKLYQLNKPRVNGIFAKTSFMLNHSDTPQRVYFHLVLL